ncbi:interferon-inducible double-stranded RNA-dependent protein kinase activator A homolog isoform X1 [Polistes fuscatus]|uniref:interferon-inducible double-stranded RNA-dependent protein kinase activator A homolog isoform X1 n=1 Tax=Polistes fuscatus TaxID=30207 RepID=UPI001CA8CDAB|nr:interferon-inducible double-stranded RNA-dependent protein kinase activator A homolog isoform X1 [Polistes fuscatus]
MLVNVGNVSTHSSNSHRRSKARLTLQAMMSESLSLSEAARLEMEALPNKTPVSVLQELLSRRGTIPKYELVQVEGVIHEPTFRYRVTVGDVIAMGTGRSKKEAKHAAAKAVLDNLIGSSNESTESAILKSLTNQSMQELEGYGEEKDLANPIGVLQEMCVSRHFPPPKYTMENEEGLPHERKFTIVCSIMNLREFGHGKSKKIAKRHAAHKMWRLLNDSGSSFILQAEENEKKSARLNAYYSDLKGSNVATLSSTHSHKVSQFHKNLKLSKGVILDKLQDTCLNDGDVNLVQFLQEIASEQHFEVTYVDIEERSVNGKCQCLVQLSTLPVAVCYGCGLTSKDAQASAAQNALEYLKIMTKK